MARLLGGGYLLDSATTSGNSEDRAIAPTYPAMFEAETQRMAVGDSPVNGIPS
jgi:hypothetical protein